MYQLLKSIEYMHRNGIFHRDVKPYLNVGYCVGRTSCWREISWNWLILGHVRVYTLDIRIPSMMCINIEYNRYISTRWYRAPECLLTDGYYDLKMDMWGVGCVMFEIIALFPIFPGNNELDQVHKIHNILGTPTNKVLDRFRKYTYLTNILH